MRVVLAAAVAAVLLASGCGSDGDESASSSTTTTAAPTTTDAPTTTTTAPPPPRLLVFSRTTGYRHDAIAAATQAITELAASAGIGVDASEDPGVFSDANLARYRAVVFLLTTGDVLDPGQEAAVERFVRAGGGYAGVHSATDTEYDWAFYGELVGARFKAHPALAKGTVIVEDATHASTAGLPARWTRTDEWYDFRSNPRPGVHVLLRVDPGSYSGSTMGADHPIAWCHAVDRGRSWYSAMGHPAEAYAEPAFRAHLLGGLRYAAGDPAASSCG